MFRQISISFHSYLEAHQFIRTHRLWGWIILPGIVYAVLFLVSIYFLLSGSGQLFTWMVARLGLSDWVSGEHSAIIGYLILFGKVLFYILVLLLYFSWFKYIFLIAGAPWFALLSEKTESLLTGKDYPFRLSQLIRDVFRGIKIALRNAFWQTLLIIALLLLGMIPVVGWVAPVISVLVECYYFGFSMLDYTSERRGLGVRKSIEFINRRKGLAIGNGLVFYVMLAIPIAGWVLAPAYAVIAATLSLRGDVIKN
ncbi:MAG: EI24 domain-containing protein [Chitinophagaceae bacterium]|nr:EI24 domain-containing protein [Chitinophagaceae bacterium]MCZ2397087.1 EI24 domain-containing protein [Chitinophagales bacterium]